MKTWILCVVFVGLLGWPIVSVAEDTEPVRVKTSRSLDLATVDLMDAHAAGVLLQQSFVANFSKSLAAPDGKAMPVRATGYGSSAAAERLRQGDSEAVFVLGERVPSALKNKKFVATRFVAEVGSPVFVCYLITRSDDETARSTLIPAFEQAVSSAGFQETLNRVAAIHVVATAEDR